jgi:hypothetical protein
VVGERAGRVADRIGGRRERRGSPKGFSMEEGIGSGRGSEWHRSGEVVEEEERAVLHGGVLPL